MPPGDLPVYHSSNNWSSAPTVMVVGGATSAGRQLQNGRKLQKP